MAKSRKNDPNAGRPGGGGGPSREPSRHYEEVIKAMVLDSGPSSGDAGPDDFAPVAQAEPASAETPRPAADGAGAADDGEPTGDS